MGTGSRFALVAVLGLWPGRLDAQDVIGPGSSLLRPPGALEGQTSFDLLMLTGTRESRTAVVRRSYRTVTRMGQRAFLLVQQYEGSDGRPTDVDSSWVRVEDLAPIAYRATVGDERHAFDFTNEGARGTIVGPDSARTVVHPEGRAAFNSVSEDLVIGSLPLREGFTATLRLYNPGRGVANVNITVEGKDSLATAEGPREAWRVRYDAGLSSEFWLDVGTRELVRSRTPLANGSEFWRVRSADVTAWRGERR